MKKTIKLKSGGPTPAAHAEPTRRALELTHLRDNLTDPMGSYTGQPEDPREKPVQDADDL